MTHIYFIENEFGHVKIGLSTDVMRRIAALRGSNPSQLKILGVVRGARALESALHQEFAEHRLAGEWFNLDETISLWIRENCEPFDASKHARVPIKLRRSTEEASLLLRQLAEPIRIGDSVNEQISRVHSILTDWSRNRVRDVWYRDVRSNVTRMELDDLKRIVESRAVPNERALSLRVADLEAQVSKMRKWMTLLQHSKSKSQPEEIPE